MCDSQYFRVSVHGSAGTDDADDVGGSDVVSSVGYKARTSTTVSVLPISNHDIMKQQLRALVSNGGAITEF